MTRFPASTAVLVSTVVLAMTDVTVCGQTNTNYLTKVGLEKFLARDFKSANDNYSKALTVDSLLYENYYLRGVNFLWTNDTVNAINDFNKSVSLFKSNKFTLNNDSTISHYLAIEPSNSDENFTLPYRLFLLQYNTWLVLNVKRK
jgi:hypothetical protein